MKVIFLGGDLRQKYASEYLKSEHIDSKVYLNFDFHNEIISEIKQSNIVALPLPASKNEKLVNVKDTDIEFGELINYTTEGTLILGGSIPNSFYNLAPNSRLIDYYQNESFQISNALLSAEGAIYYAMNKLNGSIYNSRVAILGFGRIGKILSYLLKAQGAKISIFARKEIDRAWGSLIGFDVIKIVDNVIDKSIEKQFDFDIVFNTIPNHIIDEDFIRLLPPKTMIIDLASYPFGIDIALVDKYKLNYYLETGIPGRYAPHSAGEIIGKTILNIIKKENVL